MKSFMSAFILIGTLFISGCASNPAEWFKPGNPVAEITVEIAILEYIDNDKDKAISLINFIDDVKSYLDKDPKARADEIIAVAKGLIQWDKLSDREVILAVGALSVIQQELEARIEEGGLSAGTKIYLQDFLGWVRQTAIKYVDGTPVTNDVSGTYYPNEPGMLAFEGQRDEGYRDSPIVAFIGSGSSGKRLNEGAGI